MVMMADDIANSPANPHPNQIFNRPGGPDVYDGVPVVSQSDPRCHLLCFSLAAAISVVIDNTYVLTASPVHESL